MMKRMRRERMRTTKQRIRRRTAAAMTLELSRRLGKGSGVLL
jgi:hypothetical protein